jgi:hypothetical protein
MEAGSLPYNQLLPFEGPTSNMQMGDDKSIQSFSQKT